MWFHVCFVVDHNHVTAEQCKQIIPLICAQIIQP